MVAELAKTDGASALADAQIECLTVAVPAPLPGLWCSEPSWHDWTSVRRDFTVVKFDFEDSNSMNYSEL
jgi:hypothetical protein